MKKYAFIYRSIWSENKKLLIITAIQIPINVILPYIQLYLAKVLVEGIDKRYVLSQYVAEVVCIFLVQLALTSVKDWMEATSEWNGKFVVNSLLRPLDQKTLCTDYENVEGMTGQGLRLKAVNAVYAWIWTGRPEACRDNGSGIWKSPDSGSAPIYSSAVVPPYA